nr:hypothetical protein [Peribacillus deserti]
MKNWTFPWLISGGWAIDLGIGYITRQHEDIDICIYREHTRYLLDYFCGWDIYAAVPGEHRLEAVKSAADLAPPVFCLHLFKEKQFIEILLTDKIGDNILYRRDPDIRMRTEIFARTDRYGRVFTAPEMQLLYKAKEGREKDQQDFLNYLPYMNSDSRRWLGAALQKHLPGSPWIPVLSAET